MTRTTHAKEGERHSSDVNALLFHRGKLYSGDDDGKIKVWDENLKLVYTIQDAHSKSVLALAAIENILYSGSNDGTIKSWSLSDFSSKATLSNSPKEISRLVCNNDILYAADNKGVVELYSNDKLVTHIDLIDPIKDMMAVDNLLYTLQGIDLVIRLIKSEPGNFEIKKSIIAGMPMCIAGDRLVFCSGSGQDIHLHENSTDLNFKDISLIQGAHYERIHSLVGITRNGETFLISAGADKLIKKWKIEGRCLIELSHTTMKTGINVITPGRSGEVYVGCRDGFLNRLDF